MEEGLPAAASVKPLGRGGTPLLHFQIYIVLIEPLAKIYYSSPKLGGG